MNLKVLLEIAAKMFGNVPHNPSESNLAFSSVNTTLENEINIDQSGRVDHNENERWLEKIEISEERKDELINMATENSGGELFVFFGQQIRNFEESDTGKLYFEIIESHKRQELSSESLAAYIEKMEKIEGSEPLIEELKILLEQSKIGDKSFWQAMFEPSTSGTIRATKPAIEGVINVFKLLSEKFAVRKIIKEIFTHLGDEALEKVKEMDHLSQSSSISPEQMTYMLEKMQEFYDHCKNQ